MAQSTIADKQITPKGIKPPTARSLQHDGHASSDDSTQQKFVTSLQPEHVSPRDQLEVYSVFNKSEKRIAVFLVTFAATFSPLSSFIFFPAINALSASLKVSVERVNLTVTSYMIVAGLAPAIVGDLADMTGRRNVYLLTLFIYAIANIGLAVQSSWIALFLLRMVQSAGGAATIAMGYGVISDIAPPSERGGYVGVVLLGPNFATAIGPILGGALTEAPGWRWIFWVPAIASGICVLAIAFFLPETSRSIVGNGSQPVSALHRPLFRCFGSDKLQSLPAQDIAHPTSRKFRIPNPLATLKILAARDTLLITAIYGIYYMNFSCLQGSLSTLFIDIYGLSDLKAGIVYLPFGVGSCVGAYCSGKIMNRDYRLTARAHNMTIDATHGDDLTVFPIEKARFRSIWYSICATGIATTGYGWTLHSTAHMAAPLVLQFIIGFAIAITFNCCGTLLTDLNPKSPAAAQAANNIVRCSLAGAGLAFLQPCLDAMGPGWTFTLFGGLSMACLGLAWLEWKYGKAWRQQQGQDTAVSV
ncbi:MFS general substrate transporter [Penicillium paradoxum]|uniref:MFS general substrate transporter n=1 Tax=Penicillium paradoxum TaxID=176176 RepID=UPI002547D595|nr:MFS general substrate transporter [Penicillium paradoxum]KAJ5774118.1 MFS general substrate transporter [Penicillium paradoxum]